MTTPPAAPRALVYGLVVAFSGGSLYVAVTGGDFRGAIGLAVVALLLIGVDLGSFVGNVLRAMTGAVPAEPPPPVPPAKPNDPEVLP